MKKVIIVLLATLTGFAFGQDLTTYYNLDSLSSVSKAIDSVEEAEENLNGKTILENSSLSLYGSFEGDTSSSFETDNVSSNLSLSIPLIDELKIGGTYKFIDNTGEIDLTYEPVFDKDEELDLIQNLALANFNLTQTRSESRMSIEKSFLELFEDIQDEKYQKEYLLLQQKLYEASLSTYNLGELSTSDLIEAQNTLSSANQNYSLSQQNLLQKQSEIRQLLGPETSFDSITTLTEMELINMKERNTDILSQLPEIPISISLVSLNTQLNTLLAQQNGLWAWEPDVTIKGSLSLPDLDWSISANLGISLSDFNSEEKEDLIEEIVDLEEEIELEKYSLATTTEIAKASIEVSQNALDSALRQEQQSQMLYEEGIYLLEQGDITSLELEELRLNMINNQNKVYSSYCSLITDQNNLILCFMEF